MSFNFKFWNSPIRINRMSSHQRMRAKHSVQVPGYRGDNTSRNQPGRFEKWYKLPAKAHRLYWRYHKLSS